MADDSSQDSSEKTEDPTAKRISEAVKKGQVAFSREVTSFLMLVLLALNIVWLAPIYAEKAAIALSRFIARPHDIRIDEGSIISLLSETVADIAIIITLPIAISIFVAIFSSFIQNGFVISPEPIFPKLEKISVLKGLKRMFSMRSVVEFIKGLVKISLVGIVSYYVVSSELSRLENLPSLEVIEIMQVMALLAFKITLGAVAVMFIIAVLDYLYQRFEYIKSLRMTKQELKEEFKQSEGDPQVKAKLRQIRMERAQERMMAAVPDADVVIRNPEHFAVALQYDETTMQAPIVAAMGQDFIALRIIDVAETYEIPTVRNPPLARALFDSCELGEEIPLEHYQAVAEVIGYVYRLKGKKRAQA